MVDEAQHRRHCVIVHAGADQTSANLQFFFQRLERSGEG